jgi:integrase/recombinase XerC
VNHRFSQEPLIKDAIAAFIRDKKLRGLRPRSVEYYTSELDLLARYCASIDIDRTINISSDDLRNYFVKLSSTRGAYGVHASYRAIKVFMRWYAVEYEPAGWRIPIYKVSPPILPKDPLPPVDLGVIKSMLAQCDQSTYLGKRDHAMILTLLDTGVRSSELVGMDTDDFDFTTVAIILKAERTKTRKRRVVFVGDRSRKAIRKYLKERKDNDPALWVKEDGKRIQRSTIRMVFRHICKKLGIPPPPIHGLRRTWAITMMRAKVDPQRIKKLGGWGSWDVMSRYLDYNDNDMRDAHDQGSPVDSL